MPDRRQARSNRVRNDGKGIPDVPNFLSDVLLSEYENTWVEIRSLESKNEKTLALGIALMGFAAAVGLPQNISIIFYILPVAYIGLAAFVVMNYDRIYATAGYKRFLEERINKALSNHILIWEHLWPERHKSGLVGRLLIFIHSIVGLAVLSVSVHHVATVNGWHAGAVVGVAFVLLLIPLCVAAFRMTGTTRRTYMKCKALGDAAGTSQ